jgi:NADPH-dependent glutamate synthase beta subunit-like oxidoreductase/NAD-dependent dihydropyrimidine dehydrogenase PreA subunit
MARTKDRLHRVIVVGATPAGIAAASKLGELGIPVILVDTDSDLDRKLGSDAWRLPSGLPLNFAYRPGLIRILHNPGIRTLMPAHVVSLKHTPQGFRGTIQTSPTYVDPDRCVLCGRCVAVCPVTLPDGGKPIQFFGRQALPGGAAIEKSRQPLCQANCPLGVNAQAYVALARVGRFHEALDVVRRDNVLPGICGRVCTHPCEAACRRSELDEPIAIRDIKRFVADYERDHPRPSSGPETPQKDQKVAVIGSGPAGLAAAADLVRLGYSVTVFEREAEIGGLLRYGIGPHRLPREILDEDLAYIQRCGVSFAASRDFDLSDSLGPLQDEFDAVILTVGSWTDRQLGVPGESLHGVEGCLSLLTRLYREGVGAGLDHARPPGTEAGEDVAVIGDGNAAFDTARTLRRLGSTVTIVSWFSEDRIPADRDEVKQAKEEGIRIIDQTQVTAFAGEDGKLTHLVCRPTQPGPPDANGIEWPVLVPDTGPFNLPFSKAIVAIGQGGSFPVGARFGEKGDKGLQTTSGGFLKTDPDGRTGMGRIYAAGDGVTGPSSVVQAMASGRLAAASVHADLSGEKHPLTAASRPEDRDYPDIPENIPSLARPAMPERQPSVRKDNFSEVALGLTESQVVSEAERCLQCGICSECLLCTEVCGSLKAIHHQEQSKVMVEHAGVVIIADPDAAPPVKGEDVLRAYGPKTAKPDVNAMLVRGFAAAAQAVVLLGGASQRPRGRGVSFLPPDPELSPDIRMGVFVCRCNDAFGWRDEMSQYVTGLPQREDIFHAEVMTSACVAEGIAAILRAIREKGLTRVVLASCVCCPLDFVCSACTDQRGRLKDALFHGTGVSRAMVETCNLRGEALRYLAHDPDAALNRFVGLIDRSISRARTLRPLPAPVRIYNFATAVIGESEAAVSSALTLASAGLEVFLFGTRERPLSTRLDHPNIHCFNGSKVNGLSGNLGDFQVFVETEGFSQIMQVGAVILGDRAKKEIPYIPQEGLPSFILPSSLQRSGLSGIPFSSPGATPVAGLFSAYPSGIPVSQRRAGAAAAALAAAVMPRGPRQSKGFTVVVDEDRCRGCGRCTRICPYQAVTLHQNSVGGWVARVDEALCKGCGNCISVCPSNAADSPYRNQGYLEELLGAVLVSSTTEHPAPGA